MRYKEWSGLWRRIKPLDQMVPTALFWVLLAHYSVWGGGCYARVLCMPSAWRPLPESRSSLPYYWSHRMHQSHDILDSLLIHDPYKVCAKLMVCRMKLIFFWLNYPEQGAFVDGYSISYNVFIAQKFMHDLHRASASHNLMAIKSDIKWTFITWVGGSLRGHWWSLAFTIARSTGSWCASTDLLLPS